MVNPLNFHANSRMNGTEIKIGKNPHLIYRMSLLDGVQRLLEIKTIAEPQKQAIATSTN